MGRARAGLMGWAMPVPLASIPGPVRPLSSIDRAADRARAVPRPLSPIDTSI